ncbi:hypothetical protein CREGCYN_10600 [Synechococcus sp. M16CYN]
MLRIIDYDTSDFRFREWACDVLKVNNLEKIHLSTRIKSKNSSPTTNELANAFAGILDLYDLFVKNIIGQACNGVRRYQRPPSFRFHYNDLGCSVFHRDKDFGVASRRINVWVPLTSVWGNNSLWIESNEGNSDYSPVEMEYGQALIFDGVNIRHGSHTNNTRSTRVSFDFRFTPGKGIPVPTSY